MKNEKEGEGKAFLWLEGQKIDCQNPAENRIRKTDLLLIQGPGEKKLFLMKQTERLNNLIISSQAYSYFGEMEEQGAAKQTKYNQLN